MFSKTLLPTPYYPFDAMTTVAGIPVGTLLKDNGNNTILGGMPSPFLSEDQAFELRYNVKSLLYNVPSFFLDDSSTTPEGMLIINRYTINSSNKNNVRFVAPSGITNLSVNFFIDFSLGATWIPNASYGSGLNLRAWFAPVTQFYAIANTSGGDQVYLVCSPQGLPISFSYWGTNDTTGTSGFYSQYMSDVFIPVGVTDTVGSGSFFLLNDAEQFNNPGIACTERYDEVFFSPSTIDPTISNIITITCPATAFATVCGFDINTTRNGFKYATEVWLHGIPKPIPLHTSGMSSSVASFTVSSTVAGSTAVLDKITLSLPANSGAKTGRIGIGAVYNSKDASNSYDYFETPDTLSVS